MYTITMFPGLERVMIKAIAIGVGVLLVLGGGVLYLAFSYVTASGDETRIGVRVARRLGIEP